MSLTIVAFDPGHLRKIKCRAHDRAIIGRRHDLDELAAILSSQSTAWTGLNDAGEILAIAGVLRLHPGVAEAWVVLSEAYPLDRATRPWVELSRSIRHGLARLLLPGSTLRRIQTSLPAHFSAGRRWVMHLGFRFEGLLRRYGPEGEDYAMYARTKECRYH